MQNVHYTILFCQNKIGQCSMGDGLCWSGLGVGVGIVGHKLKLKGWGYVRKG